MAVLHVRGTIYKEKAARLWVPPAPPPAIYPRRACVDQYAQGDCKEIAKVQPLPAPRRTL